MKKEYYKSISIKEPVKISFTVKSNFPFERYTKNKDIPYLEPVYDQGKCSIYYGDFKKGTGPKTPSASYYIQVTKLNKKMESLESVLEFIKSLQGYYKAPKDYPIELKTNSHGVIYSKVAFLYRGGQSYTYILLLGKHQVLISDAAWIDTDSLKTL